MATIFKLIIEDDEGKTTVYPLSEGEISIGRKEGNTIRLMERNVSRRHARLLRKNGTVFVEDLDSYNGIRINGERISGRYEVKEGDLVEIGDYHLALQQVELVDEAPPLHHDDTKRTLDERPKTESWPLQAGTVPDFRLPSEILAEVRDANMRGPRDTLIDTPVPSEAMAAAAFVQTLGAPQTAPRHEPLVKPPSRGGEAPHELPPFPGPAATPREAPANGRAEAKPDANKPLAQAPARIAQVARLVCVSTDYAGRDFALARPEIVIGRVEENDVVIEHRSVSRNHAKIIHDGKSHKIIDLQSANGILVNGEEYAMTDLRKGDLIELGHVRFRFIPAGESFEPTPEEAQAMREAGVEPRPPAETPPPKAESDVTPAYDPSNAATVTDTPLSALAMAADAETPKVEAGDVPVVDKRAGAVRAHRPEEEKPTELARSVRHGGQTNVFEEAAKDPDEADRDEALGPRPKIGVLLGGVVVGILALGLIAYATLGPPGPDGKIDAEMKALFERGQYKEAVEYFKVNKGGFRDVEAAAVMYVRAVEKASELKPAPKPNVAPEGDSSQTPIPKAMDDGDGKKAPDERPPAEAATPEGDAPDALDESPAESPVIRRKEKPRSTVTKAKDRPKPSVPAASTRQRAFELNAEAFRALNEGDVSRAQDLLRECLKVAPKYPECHRTLGVLFMQIDQKQRALDHYKRYLSLAPNAPDSDNLRKWIQEAEEPR